MEFFSASSSPLLFEAIYNATQQVSISSYYFHVQASTDNMISLSSL